MNEGQEQRPGGQGDLGSPHGGGEQGERIEGSFTDGGSLPGARDEDRSFGAGRAAQADREVQAQTRAPGQPEDAAKAPPQADDPAAGAIFQGQGEDPGAIDEEAARPGTEHSGYGNTPPR